MKSYSSFSFFILVASVSSFGAGNEVGNGGNAVICKKTVELLDFYESKILRGWELDPAATNTKDDAFSNAKSKIEALQKFDPKTARVLLAGLARLQKDFSFEQEISIQPLGDSLHVFTPKDPECRVEQFVVLRKHPLPDEKRVLINRGIWDRLDLSNQTGTVLHETIYEYFAELGEKESTKARYLVSYLMGKDFVTAGLDGYWAKVKALRVPIYR